jgi:NAD(P)H dehydrogenase (quinone)
MPGEQPVVVLAGRGKTGRSVATALGRRGVAATAVGRADWPRLGDALRGARAVHVIAPNLHPDEPGYVDEVVVAARSAGVRRLVYHSVAAPCAPAMPHHLGKARSEDLVRRSGLAWTVLQPCAYVQNLLPGLRADPPAVRQPYSTQARFGLVDLDDVGEAAAAVLLDDAHVGASYELGGPALVSTADVARVAADVLGRPVLAERVPPEEWARTGGAGLEPRERDWLLRMFEYYDDHGLPAGSLPLAALLGRPATPLEETLRRELAGSA